MKRTFRKLSIYTAFYFLAASVAWPEAELPERDCGVPPPKPPQHRAGGEGVPPLPLPAVPLRRSEKKEPPAPPTLLAHLQFGPYESWNSDPGALVQMFNRAAEAMKVRYGHTTFTLDNFSYDAHEIPILYFGGTKEFEFTNAQRAKLRKYMEEGGTLFLEANSGFDAFRNSAAREIKAIFPEKELRRLPLDHPVFTSLFKVTEVQYMKTIDAVPDNKPYLEGVDVGTRTVLFYSRYGMACSWDGHTHKNNRGVAFESANHIGANLLAYCIAEHNNVPPIGQAVAYDDKGEERRSQIVIGQLQHRGEWHATPSAIPALLENAVGVLNVKAKFQQVPVDLTKDDLTRVPFLFVSGMYDFQLNETEAARLRMYLTSGGFLFAESCEGRDSFDKAFRREMKKVFPDKDLDLLQPNHPLFTTHYQIGQISYTARVKELKPDLSAPVIEGITMDDRAVVVYSRYSLSTGWEGNLSPYNMGVATKDALQIGVNVIQYALTH
ncbi:MAG: DUF4159 domain-containing protein [Verrucomicrobiae bacterium]|nr:DUF4159 domain-containing protein [Verrucomicrobiae bacterium]